jgi:UDP-glucose 4-epimerase
MASKQKRKILVTGGAGYIGSHMVRMLLGAGLTPVILDNLSTGRKDFVPPGVAFIKGDLRVPADIRKVFKKHKIDAVIHFAAAIVVPESVADPLKYYENNVTASINLLQVMDEFNVRKIVFSSSACVYGEPRHNPIRENEPLKVENPYGATKAMVEQILKDLAATGKVKFIVLRYFNVAGAHPDGTIGLSLEKPTHLIPNVMLALNGRRGGMTIYGEDYPTKDGTCIRDYIHVMDLCEAHLLALKAMDKGKVVNELINIGTGCGNSVLEVFKMAEKIVGRKAPVTIAPRRPGDCIVVVASYAKAKKLLGWTPKHDLKDIISSAWTWEIKRKKS